MNSKDIEKIEKLLFEVYSAGINHEDCNLTEYSEKLKSLSSQPSPEKEEEKKFEVYSLSTFEEKQDWNHWSKGLTTFIIKDGKKIILSGEEMRKVVKSLPRTFGGKY